MIKFGKKLPKNILVKAVEKLPAVFEKDPQIVAAYIYGSYATGKTTDLSDIDIAVLLWKKGDWKKQLELIDSIAEALETEDFDLLILNDCPPYMQYEVISSGKMIYEKDRDERCDFQVRVLQRYFDVKYIYDEYNYYLKKRIKEGGMLS
jgi:hypothetical protein